MERQLQVGRLLVVRQLQWRVSCIGEAASDRPAFDVGSMYGSRAAPVLLVPAPASAACVASDDPDDKNVAMS